MAVTPARVVLFLIGLFAAVGLVGYGSGAFGPDQAEPEVAAQEPSGPAATTATQPSSTPLTAPQVEPAVPSSIPDGAQPQPASAEPQTNAAVDKKAEPDTAQPTRSGRVTPSFDILRVEPDGSTVVAGRAKPGATVEMMSGDAVLGQAKVSPNGDFAIALDQPLPAGDHTLALRANSDGGSATSTEMAIVSVPREKNGQVLAMVQQPGQPSRLISLPQAHGAGETANTASEQPATPSASPQPEQQAASPAAEPNVSNVAAEALQAPAPNPAAASSTSVAAVSPAQPVQAAQGTAAPTVEAVEIEGSMIYVAGRASPGAKLRAYANDDFLGEATASPDGQFLVEAKRDLAVGNYTIRVDAIGTDGATVTQRAAVPFEREAGETLAAVAPSQARPATNEAPAAITAAPQPAAGENAASEPAAAPTADQAPAGSSAATVTATAPSEVTAPTLQPVKGAVIIRRGDSLWRISKRAYGRGVRYSTIYLANQDQIQNPNRIWPGQVFQMPNSTSEGEKADMSRLGDQATTSD
jgi:nucleoid-associated protein YgaU